ncbi:MAG TPA: hypothetical protein VIF32_02850 [Gemmatimonadaceae bacterium]|jgi:hypothetical protein
MRTVYRLLSAGQVALGVVHMSATAVLFDQFSTRALWFASGGLAIALTGALNLLREAYGNTAPGVRWVAVTANAALAVFTILYGVAMGASPVQWAFVAILSGGPAVLSLVPSAQRPAGVAA